METLYIPEASRSKVAEKTPNIETLSLLIEFFNDETLVKEIEAGNITLAMIRPELPETTINIDGNDIERAEKIEELIEDLGVVTKFAINFDMQAFDEFYGGGPKKAMLNCDPDRDLHHKSKWEEFGATMTNGPTTILVLHSFNGDAGKKWRDQVGHRDIENQRNLSNIRGQIGRDNYSTVIHGSDPNPQAVLREFEVIKNCLERKITTIFRISK